MFLERAYLLVHSSLEWLTRLTLSSRQKRRRLWPSSYPKFRWRISEHDFKSASKYVSELASRLSSSFCQKLPVLTSVETYPPQTHSALALSIILLSSLSCPPWFWFITFHLNDWPGIDSWVLKIRWQSWTFCQIPYDLFALVNTDLSLLFNWREK